MPSAGAVKRCHTVSPVRTGGSPGSLISLGVFQKDISTLSGTIIIDSVPFSQLGLPLSLLNGTNVQASDLFEYRRVVNGDGGEINGVEVNYQHQLRFLPGFLSNLGVLANYTYVDADIDYPGPGGSAPVSGPLTNLSKNAANGTTVATPVVAPSLI